MKADSPSDPLALPSDRSSKPTRSKNKKHNKSNDRAMTIEQQEELEMWIQKYLAVCRKCDACNLYFPAPKDALECLKTHGLRRCFACFSSIGQDIVSLVEHTRLHHFNSDHPTLVKCPFCSALQSPHDGGLENHVLQEHSESALMQALLTGDMSLALPKAMPPRALPTCTPPHPNVYESDSKAGSVEMVLSVHPNIVALDDEEEVEIADLQQMQVSISAWTAEEESGAECITLEDNCSNQHKEVDQPHVVSGVGRLQETEETITVANQCSGYDSGFASNTSSPNELAAPSMVEDTLSSISPSIMALQQVVQSAEQAVTKNVPTQPTYVSPFPGYEVTDSMSAPPLHSDVTRTSYLMSNQVVKPYGPFPYLPSYFCRDNPPISRTNVPKPSITQPLFHTAVGANSPIINSDNCMSLITTERRHPHKNGVAVKSTGMLQNDAVIPSTVQELSDRRKPVGHVQTCNLPPAELQLQSNRGPSENRAVVQGPYKTINAHSIIETIIDSMFQQQEGSNDCSPVGNNTVVNAQGNNGVGNIRGDSSKSLANLRPKQQSLLKLNNTIIPNPLYKKLPDDVLMAEPRATPFSPSSTKNLSEKKRVRISDTQSKKPKPNNTLAPPTTIGARRYSNSISISPVQPASSVGIPSTLFHSAPRQQISITPVLSRPTTHRPTGWKMMPPQLFNFRTFLPHGGPRVTSDHGTFSNDAPLNLSKPKLKRSRT